jgi:hypothetical protein
MDRYDYINGEIGGNTRQVVDIPPGYYFDYSSNSLKPYIPASSLSLLSSSPAASSATTTAAAAAAFAASAAARYHQEHQQALFVPVPIIAPPIIVSSSSINIVKIIANDAEETKHQKHIYNAAIDIMDVMFAS